MTSRAGQGKRYVVLGLLALFAPADWALERAGVLPPFARDRAPFVAAAVALVVVLGLLRVWRQTTGRARWLACLPYVAVLGVTLGFAEDARADYRLPASSASMKLGAPLVNAKLTADNGEKVDLTQLAGKPTLVVWFRGSWCPYCKHQLKKLAREVPNYGADVRVLAVTWDPQEQIAELRKELALPFPVLSDPDGVVMGRCELMHCVAVIDAKGVVEWGVISGNWRNDIPERALMQKAFEHR